jgi:integrase
MSTTYKVRVFEIQKRYRQGDETKTRPSRYVVRWSVNGAQFDQSFKHSAQAKGFRSELQTAVGRGEAFDVRSGLPVSMLRPVDTPSMSVFEFALDYSADRWEELKPGSRRNLVTDLSVICARAVRAERGRPDSAVLARALRQTLNVRTRDSTMTPAQETAAVAWVHRQSRDVRELGDPTTFRALVSALDKKRDGTRAAPDTIRLRRTTLNNFMERAQERGLLDSNPFRAVKVRKNKAVLREVDTRAVLNPMQARTLLLAVRVISRRLVAFFALMYFAGLRPEEAVNVRKSSLSLPREGWGEIRLERAVPEVAAEWTDSGERHEETSLKHREDHQTRPVPCCPELTAVLHEHLRMVGTADDGRLFWGERSHARLGSSVYGRVWAKARREVFTPEVFASPLAKRPYDLRHACVSSWLTAGVEPTKVAAWAGHSVAVLLRVYAKVVDGGTALALRRIDEWFGVDPNRH